MKWAYNKQQQNSRISHYARVVQQGFTIVELLIVVVVIAILAAIVIVSYNGITANARQSAADQLASQNATKLALYHSENGSYPSDVTSTGLTGTYEYTQTGGGTGYCLTAYSDPNHTAATKIENGMRTSKTTCTGHTAIGAVSTPVIADGTVMQTVTSANCPSTRTRVYDARDNHTYWVQKLPYGKCWMLTNLAYQGGGTNTYNDTKTMTKNAAISYLARVGWTGSYTVSSTEPANPSTSTDGGATGTQYGYLYNWCAAMGVQDGTAGQPNTAACANATTPAVDPSISICPAGWRLPTGGPTGEFAALNTAVNGGATNTDAGLRTTWLAQYAGNFYNNMFYQGTDTAYWSSTPNSAGYSYVMSVGPSAVNVSASNGPKTVGYPVRCVAV